MPADGSDTVSRRAGFVCVANFDSDVGYAWWLMESFWVLFAEEFGDDYKVLVAYPSISRLPAAIEASQLGVSEADFTRGGLLALWRQLRFIRRHRVEVIYLSDQPAVRARYALYRLAGVRTIVVHDHSPGLRSRPEGLRRSIKQFAARLPWVVADSAVGATNFVRRRLVTVNCLPRTRCYAANNGLPARNESLPTRDPYAEFDIPRARRILVTAARANAVKRIDFALDVIAKILVADDQADVHYLFFGDGPELADLQQQALRLGIADRVTFAGNVPDPEGFYSGCHFAMHPSGAEVGYSLAILEYMRAGLPVVVPDNKSVCGATTDEVDGLVYREGDADDAAEKLQALLGNEKVRRRMADTARARVEKDYRLEVTHRELLAAMKATLEKAS